jgi:kumamolisin
MQHSPRGRARRRAAQIGAIGAVACAVTAGVLVSTGTAQAAQQPRVAVPGSATPAIAGAHRDSSVAADQKISVAVSLKLHNTAQLNAFDTAVSTPGSAQYGHYLTPAQFAADFSPTTDEVAQVKQYLASTGLTVTGVSGNRQVVDATGTASQVSSAFATSLSNYTQGSTHYYTNDSAVTLPSGVASVVQGVSGLNNRPLAHPESAPLSKVTPKAGSPVGGFSPTQYDGAYKFSSVGEDGTGVTVALWEFDGYKTSDLTAYNSYYGLSGPAATTVSVDGANYDSSPGDGEPEVELDSEIVRGVAPKASQLVYEAPNSDAGQIDMANAIATQDRVSVVSISWGECEAESTASTLTSTDNALSQAVAEGISVYSASGDSGSKDCQSGATGVDYPASSPYVTGVGGTTLSLSGNNWSSETAWTGSGSAGGSGGGVSSTYARPSWQTGTNAKRTVPDVSADANPSTGYAVYSGGGWDEYGGTSCAAPMWAGFTALVNEKAAAAGKANVGFMAPKVYPILTSGYATNFHDITSGNNGGFSAGTGYDEVTGIGTPIGDALATTLVGSGGGTGGNTVTVTNPGSQSTTTGSSVSLQISATDSAGAALTYSATGLPTGLSISSAGLITGTASTAGTFSTTVTAKDSTNASGSASFTWTVSTSGGGGGTCTGNKLGNPGFESGNTVWTASTDVIGQNASQGEATHGGTWNAWLDGYGTTHTDTVSQSVTIPAGCTATFSFYLHIDTAETSKSTAYDKLTVKNGSTTLATYSNLNAASGYAQKSFNVSSSAGKSVTLTFTGTEDSSLQTSFVLDDTAVTLS